MMCCDVYALENWLLQRFPALSLAHMPTRAHPVQTRLTKINVCISTYVFAYVPQYCVSHCPCSSIGLFQLSVSSHQDWPETMSSGSLGHPFLCKAPCIRAVHGTCMKGPRCEFCHLEHNHPKRKLRREETRFVPLLVVVVM